jgi:annexin A7/11
MNQKTPQDLKELEKMTIQFHDAIFNIVNPKSESLVVDILSNTTNLDRQIIRRYYKKMYNVPVQSDIKSELNSELKTLAIDLFDLPYEFDARELHRSLTSLMADDNTIIEILVTRPKSHLHLTQKIYKKFYKTTLKEDISKLSSKEFSQFLLILLETPRPTQPTITINDAYNIAKEILRNGLKSYGTDENLFKKTFVEKSREDLILISRAFFELYKKNLYDSFESEISGRNNKLLKGLLFGVITPAQYFAKKTFKSIQGVGTDETTLFRVMVSRAEVDMDAIREYYFKDNNTDIKNDIEGDTSGAYGQILMNLSSK